MQSDAYIHLHTLTCRVFPLSLMTEQLAAIPEFQGLGPLFKSSEPVQLTEAETEYVVRCIKHTFARHMVFQFDCTNTLNDQLLQKVPAERGIWSWDFAS